MFPGPGTSSFAPHHFELLTKCPGWGLTTKILRKKPWNQVAQGRLHHQWFLYPFPVTSRRSHQNHIGDSLAQPLMSKYGWTTLQPTHSTPLCSEVSSEICCAIFLPGRGLCYCPWPVRFFCLIKIKILLCWTLVTAWVVLDFRTPTLWALNMPGMHFIMKLYFSTQHDQPKGEKIRTMT